MARRATRTGGWTIALILWLAASGLEASGEPIRAAVLRDNVSGLDLSLADEVVARLRAGGLVVRPIRCDELASASVFDAVRFDVLVVTHSPTFPAVAGPNLRRFLGAGGDLVLMGGHAFGRSTCKLGDRWCSPAELAAAMASAPTVKVFFDFEGGVGGWSRSSSEMTRPTRLASDRGKVGGGIRIDVKQLNEGWDTHAHALPSRFDAGANALCFWARASEHTPQMAVELDEQDGSRWIAVVDLTAIWKRYVLTAARFKFWRDGSPRPRGPDERLDLAKARRVSFGIAFGITAQPPGDHTLWIDEVGAAKADVPPGADRSATLDLEVFSDYEPHQLRDVTRVSTAPGQDVLKTDLSIGGRFEGTSAIGFALPARSTFVPLLAARDGLGRWRGWAGGLLIHYDGEFKGSNWLLFGVTSPAFYRSARFAPALRALIEAIVSPKLAERAKADDVRSRAARLKLTTPAPTGFLRRSADGKHLASPDGRRFFMTGCNYLGPFDRKCYIGGDLFDARLIEDDFRKCRDAGVNCLRFWLHGLAGDPTKVATVRELARRYGVYLLLHLGPRAATSERIVAEITPAVRAFKDEPMVLGYDLINEPYLGTVGAITHQGRRSAILELNAYETLAGQFSKRWVDDCIKHRPAWPQMHHWVKGRDARDLYAAYSMWNRYQARFRIGSTSTFPGIKDRLPVDDRWRPFIEVVDETFATWIRFQVEAIRAVDKRHLITVGYNSVLSCLPANRQLDFVSQHVYQRPRSYKDVMTNVTTLDRLARVWPDQPITFGEFGYSNGIRVRNGYLDPDTSAVGEMMHYLYALSRGYDGCMKWSLTDWPLDVIRHNAPWIQGDDKQVYESRFGLYCYDGTMQGRPKPIAHALRFLRDHVARWGPGGQLEIKQGKTAIGAVYVYRAGNALFVGDAAYQAPGLSLEAKRPTNLMLTWGKAALDVMSTADATVEIEPSRFVPGLTAESAALKGRCGGRKVNGTSLVLNVLAGARIRIE